MEFVTLVRQDQLARWVKASIATWIVGSAKMPFNTVPYVLIECVNGLGVTQVDAALPASFGDRGPQADFFAERT
jgi:hypothetical protein